MFCRSLQQVWYDLHSEGTRQRKRQTLHGQVPEEFLRRRIVKNRRQNRRNVVSVCCVCVLCVCYHCSFRYHPFASTSPFENDAGDGICVDTKVPSSFAPQVSYVTRHMHRTSHVTGEGWRSCFIYRCDVCTLTAWFPLRGGPGDLHHGFAVQDDRFPVQRSSVVRRSQ